MRAGIAGGIGLQIVGLGVDDDRMADHAIFFAADRKPRHGYFQVGMALIIGGEIAEIAGVMLGGIRAAMVMAVGVEMSAGAAQVGALRSGLA